MFEWVDADGRFLPVATEGHVEFLLDHDDLFQSRFGDLHSFDDGASSIGSALRN
jgi:hypothetical protein